MLHKRPSNKTSWAICSVLFLFAAVTFAASYQQLSSHEYFYYHVAALAVPAVLFAISVLAYMFRHALPPGIWYSEEQKGGQPTAHKATPVIVCTMIFMFMLGIFSMFYEPYTIISKQKLWNGMLWFGLPISTVSALAFHKALKNILTKRDSVICIALLGLPTIMAFTYSAQYYTNILLDESKLVIHKQPILERTEKRPPLKGKPQYYVVTPNWEKPKKENMHIQVSYQKYQQAKDASMITLQTQSGFLDVSWVKHYEVH